MSVAGPVVPEQNCRIHLGNMLDIIRDGGPILVGLTEVEASHINLPMSAPIRERIQAALDSYRNQPTK